MRRQTNYRSHDPEPSAIALEDHICLLILVISEPHEDDIALHARQAAVVSQAGSQNLNRRRKAAECQAFRSQRTVLTQTFFRILPRM